jgi:hypothetical protein
VKLTRAVTVHCGNHRLSWNWISDGMEKILNDYSVHKSWYHDNDSIEAETAPALEGQNSLKYQSRDKTTIQELLWDNHASKFVDGGDRIFALYRLIPHSVTNTDRPWLWEIVDPFPHTECPVDYSRQCSSIYIQLATAAVTKGDDLMVIGHALAFGGLSQQNPEWPSWVPSWNMERRMREQVLLVSNQVR